MHKNIHFLGYCILSLAISVQVQAQKFMAQYYGGIAYYHCISFRYDSAQMYFDSARIYAPAIESDWIMQAALDMQRLDTSNARESLLKGISDGCDLKLITRHLKKYGVSGSLQDYHIDSSLYDNLYNTFRSRLDTHYIRIIHEVDSLDRDARIADRKEPSPETRQHLRETDSLNLHRFLKLFESYPPTHTPILTRYDKSNLFRLLLHCYAEFEIAGQNSLFSYIHALFQSGFMYPSIYANLIDRRRHTLYKLPEIYGSDMTVQDSLGNWHNLPLVDPEKIDIWRKEIGYYPLFISAHLLQYNLPENYIPWGRKD